MEKLARFSDYDVFAYIASGLAALVVWDIIFSTRYVLGAEWTAASGVLTIAFAYIVGQILAAPSGWLIERRFVHRILFRPSAILMNSRRLGWRRLLKRSVLQDYYTPLDTGLQQKVRERATVERGAEVAGEDLFWCAFPIAKKDANAYARMESFLKLYGFCRNLAFVGLAGACFIAADAALEWARLGWSSHVGQRFRWALLATLIGFGMLHRYLKFFRLYNVEVFVAYSDTSQEGSKPK
jgi:hypothetical protein